MWCVYCKIAIVNHEYYFSSLLFHTVPMIIWIGADTKNMSLSNWNRCNSICLVFVPDSWTQKPVIYSCICSSRERLGVYAEIQIIVGAVQASFLNSYVPVNRVQCKQKSCNHGLVDISYLTNFFSIIWLSGFLKKTNFLKNGFHLIITYRYSLKGQCHEKSC